MESDIKLINQGAVKGRGARFIMKPPQGTVESSALQT